MPYGVAKFFYISGKTPLALLGTPVHRAPP